MQMEMERFKNEAALVAAKAKVDYERIVSDLQAQVARKDAAIEDIQTLLENEIQRSKSLTGDCELLRTELSAASQEIVTQKRLLSDGADREASLNSANASLQDDIERLKLTAQTSSARIEALEDSIESIVLPMERMFSVARGGHGN